MGDAYQEIHVSEIISLTCNFAGYPRPSAVWLHNGAIERTDLVAGVSVVTDHQSAVRGAITLNVTTLGSDDRGTYTCRVGTNGDEHNITIRILCE